MITLLTSGTGLSKIACSAEECLSWIIILLNILTIFYLVFCAWFKVTKTVKIVGYVWASALTVGTIAVVAVHTCIFTILSAVFTGLILMAVLSVVFNKGVFANESEEEKPLKASGAYVIHRTDDNKYVFLLYNNKRKAVSRSCYKYNTVDDVKKAIAICRENGLFVSVENKTKSWIEFVNHPKFVMYAKDGKFCFHMTLSNESVFLKSEVFDINEQCEKTMKEALSAVKSDKLFYSEQEILSGKLFLLSSEEAATVTESIPEKIVEKKEIVEEKAIVEEVPTEEIAATEEVIEEVAPVAEEVSEAEVVEEKAVEPEEVKEVAPIVNESVIDEEAEIGDDDDEDESVVVMDEQGNYFRIRYNKCFTAKLMQSPDITKAFYTELKNEILSYKPVRSRVSWAYDSINIGRKQLIKFSIRGKTLCVYFALNPDDFIDTKYKVEKSEAAKYEDVPCLYRIRNGRRLRYAKDLMALACKNMGLKKGEVPTVDYTLPYETTEALIQKGMVKEVKVKI